MSEPMNILVQMSAWQFVAAWAIIGVCALLMLVILIQKGRGDGLVGAFGGGGGSSAFGTKTGDIFTWITCILAAVFVLLAVVGNYAMDRSNPPASSSAAAPPPISDTTVPLEDGPGADGTSGPPPPGTLPITIGDTAITGTPKDAADTGSTGKTDVISAEGAPDDGPDDTGDKPETDTGAAPESGGAADKDSTSDKKPDDSATETGGTKPAAGADDPDGSGG